MPVDEDLGGICRAGVLADDRQGALQFDVVLRQVGGEVRGLARPVRAATLLQIQRVKGEAAVGKVVGQSGIEEVVGEAVHRQNACAEGAAFARRTRVATMSPSSTGSGPNGIVYCS